jgi:anti-sigma regulatory factor (Ser/Thr protein kinase)
MSCEHLLAAQHPIPVQAGRESQHIHLTPVPTAAGEARRFVRSTASVLDDERLDDVLVLTSELVTNAVLHARTPLEVGVSITDDVVLICVGDGCQATPVHPSGQTPSDGSENGRGIMLIRALADDWGVLPAETRQGKAVWFLFRRATSESVSSTT